MFSNINFTNDNEVRSSTEEALALNFNIGAYTS